MYVEDEYGYSGECECDACSFWPNCSGCCMNPIYNEKTPEIYHEYIDDEKEHD